MEINDKKFDEKIHEILEYVKQLDQLESNGEHIEIRLGNIIRDVDDWLRRVHEVRNAVANLKRGLTDCVKDNHV